MTDQNLQFELLQKRQKLQLLQKRKELRESNGLAFYKPHPKQDQFHRAAKYRRRYVRTGNRFGKSDMGASEDCAYAIGERPWYPVGDPARTVGIPKHSTKGCIVVQDWDKATEIFTNMEPGTSQGKLFAKLPPDAIVSVKKGRSGNGIAELVVKSIHGGHSTIHLETVRSFIQNPMGMESSNWDWIHIDEPCPKNMWTALSRGLIDRGGSAWFTCTPITEAWINDYFLPPAMARATISEAFINESFKHPRWMITGSSYDNPYIDAGDIDEFKDDISKDEQACRIDGVPAMLSGVVYKDFDHSTHVYRDCPHGWTDPQTPPHNYTIRTFIDPHPRTPHAILHFATAPCGTTYIFRELFRNGLIPDIVDHILAQVDGYHVEDFIIDPIAFIENPQTGLCMADDFYDAGVPVVAAPKDLTFGILKTQQRWRERDRHDNPTLLVHESCDEFLFEIDRYVWDRDKEKPRDVDDHMMENLYRAVLTKLKYVDESTRVAPKVKPLEVTQDSWRRSGLLEEDNYTSLHTIPSSPIPHSERYLN